MLKALNNNPYFNAIRNILTVLDKDQKKKSIVIIFLMLVNAFFDLLGLATIMVLIKSALEGDVITKVQYNRTDAGSDIEFLFNNGLRNIYDYLGVSSEIELLFYLSILIFIIFIIKNALSLFITYVQATYAYNISLRLNKKMFKYYYDQGYLFITDSNSGKKVYSIVDIPMRFAGSYLNPTLLFSTDFVVIAILCFGLLMYKPIAILMLILVVAPVFLGIYIFSKNRIKEIGDKRNRVSPLNYAKVIEAMKAYVDVKLGNREKEVLRNYEISQKDLNHTDALYQGLYAKISQKTNDIVFGLGILVIFCFAYYSNTSKESVLTLLGFFGVAAYKVLPAINNMMNALLSIKNSTFVIDELKLIANQTLDPFVTVDTMEFNHSIELEGIHYSYPNTDISVLSNINFTINKGDSIGIIGSSGSGKTTFLKLFLRLILENSGSFKLDGKKLDTPGLNASFQLNVGYVEQDVYISEGTMEENIAFGIDDIDYALLETAIEGAMLSEFIKQQKEGVKMHLGDGGVKLSGGQKQRVGIARALYKKSEILVFDEATSALDSKTEKAIVESINHLSQLGKTIVIVAHRITTLEKCNRIIELKGGQIFREPKYEELIKELVENH